MPCRVIRPEILDHLPPSDPRALHSRRDLRLLNALMGNYRWLLRKLREWTHEPLPSPILELGAGTGDFAQILHRSGRTTGYAALDLAPAPHTLPSEYAWHRHDLLKPLPTGLQPGIVVANLCLHHFDRSELAAIGHHLRNARAFLISEPARHPAFHLHGYACRIFGLSEVTRHDLHVSIDAGFRGNELPRFLGLTPETWNSEVHITPLGAYRLRAWRSGDQDAPSA